MFMRFYLVVDGDITSAVKTEILPHVSLQYMYGFADNISQSLCNKKWNIYYIESDEFFVTSDTPVMFESINPEENRSIDPAHPQSLVLCPITKKMLIAARPYCKSDCSDFEFMPVKDGMVKALNEFMCFNAQRFVYASEKSQELLEHVKKAKGMRKRLKSYRLDKTIISRGSLSSSFQVWGIMPYSVGKKTASYKTLSSLKVPQTELYSYLLVLPLGISTRQLTS